MEEWGRTLGLAFDQLPTEYYGGKRVTEAMSIFKEKAWELICYFCSFWEKEWIWENNGVTCYNPKSPVSWKITSAVNNCDENSEGPGTFVQTEIQWELAI